MKKRIVSTAIVLLLLITIIPFAKVEAACDHKWRLWDSYAATYSEPGGKRYICDLCNAKKEEEIPVKSTTKKQKKVKETIDTFFQAAQKYKIPKMKKCFTSSAHPAFFKEKKYMAKFMKFMNEDLEYNIVKIKISGKNATVKVKCNYRSACKAYTSAYWDLFFYILKHPNASSSKLDKYQYQKTLKYFHTYSKPHANKTIKIPLKKVKGKWKISEWSYELSNAVHANYQKAYNKFPKTI